MTAPKIPWKQARHHWPIYLFILPALLLIGLFQYYPAASGIYHSFFRWNGADISEFTGFQNYLDLLQNPEFWNSFKVAFILGGWNILKMIPALLVAVCIHRCTSTRMQFLYRSLFVIPMVIPGLVTALIWRSFFFEATSGYMNQFLHVTGLFELLTWVDHKVGWGIFVEGGSPAWLGDPRLILTACIVWGFPWVGSFAVLMHLAKLQSIDKALYEAADIDGVNWWTKFTRIELPLIMGSVYILVVFVIIETVKDAGMILALAGIDGGPGGVVTVPALFMLRKAFLEQQMGYACAVGIVLTACVMILQKLSVGLLNWRDLGSVQKMAFRIALALLAVLMLVTNRFVPLAVMLLFFAVPYGGLAAIGGFGALVTRLTSRTFRARQKNGEGALSESFDAVLARRDEQRQSKPWYPFARRAGDIALRLNKHLTIWVVLAFAFLPLYLMVIVSFKTNRQFYMAPATITQPLHFENWSEAWHLVLPAIANSLFISIFATALTLLIALGGAYFFARLKMPLSGFFWNAILLMMMIPTIANLIPLFTLLGSLGLLNTLTALILVGTSGGIVFGIFVLRNFVEDIPRDLFEAADIDGAGHWRQMIMVVLPLSGPILGTIGVMRFIAEWNEFILPLIVIRDADRLPVMVQLLRLAGEYVKFWGPLMAGYALASIPVIILFLFSMKLFVRGLTDGATKG